MGVNISIDSDQRAARVSVADALSRCGGANSDFGDIEIGVNILTRVDGNLNVPGIIGYVSFINCESHSYCNYFFAFGWFIVIPVELEAGFAFINENGLVEFAE